MSFRRPKSLKEVARLARRGGEFHARLREFLDTFYSVPTTRRAAIAEEPAPTGDAIQDVYLAAAAEHLALSYGLPIPAWVHGSGRFLRDAHFAGPDGMKAILLAESPASFRRRMLFVDFDPLSRPRRRGRKPSPPPWGPSRIKPTAS